jgi:3-oxoacyl-[acyl-carrier protein] reductase
MRNVIVTGGSRGLGLAIARKLSAASFSVVAVARRDTDDLQAAIRDAEAAGAGAIAFAPFDLAEVDKISDLAKDQRRRFGAIYGLVNNAAIGLDGVLATMHNSRIEQVLRLNTLSPIVLTKYVVRAMMADGGGRIVNVASIVATTGFSGLSVYAASKSSMIGFTRSLAREVGRLGITVNAVAPGFLATEMTGGIDAEQLQQVARRSALRQLAAVDDVANAVEFLMGDKANSMTGTVMTVDAGATA